MRESERKAQAGARIGQQLRGKYRLDAVLGVGGMASVFAATHRNKKRFAVKILHPELSTRTDIRQRFLREGYAANSVRHPGAVAILDDDVAEDGAAFLVMELLDGVSAEALCEGIGGTLPVPAVLTLAHELLGTLAAAHASSIVHRDIKPANLFVLRDGAVKVLDFGIARVMEDDGGSSATSTGTMLGTPAFMAPEQANGAASQVDARTDIWGAGATMFTLLSGQFVHMGETPRQVAVRAATQPARSLSAAVPDVPAPVVTLVDRALSFEKADRWESAQAMRDALASACESVSGKPVTRSPLAALVEEHILRSGTLKALAPTEMDAGSDTALAPTVSADRSSASGHPSALARTVTPPGGATTGAQVSEPRPPVGRLRRSRASLGVPVAAIGLVAAGFALARLAGRDSTPSPTLPASSPAPSAASAARGQPSFALAQPSSSATGTANAEPTDATSRSPPALPLVRRPALPPATASAAASAPATKPRCNPPWVVDSNGDRQYKPECL
jgi:serine/threonine-protein kinase